ncbi:AEC family transporter [Flexithrix dorotheae]|uniref:AEC family transporter n=1 Tax=Flexithrix dorotheae TaxID=70993 RepID=UPI00036EFE07|nr:hypothetical protein [Flexithrix dorotheae]
MNSAFAKTITLLILIGVGVMLRGKIATKEKITGIKNIILSVALPATIFLALLKINIDVNLLLLPVIAIVFNLIILGLARVILVATGLKEEQGKLNSFMFLFPSLAPGLSCFPFLAEYLGEESVALAALADIGNKIFVLIILYLLAMQLHYSIFKKGVEEEGQSKFKSLLLALVKEPVNMAIVIAIVLLSFGLTITDLPEFVGSSIGKMSAIMTPLVLIFIGIAAKIKWNDLKLIVNLLALRSGLAFLFSGAIIYIFQLTDPVYILVTVTFFQSSCSFWPYAHICAIDAMEKDHVALGKQKTFDSDIALVMLATSLPFSTLIMLSIFSFSEVMLDYKNSLLIGICFVILSCIPIVIKLVKKSRAEEEVKVLEPEMAK